MVTFVKESFEPETKLNNFQQNNSQQAYEKMLNIANHQRNANQNHNEISSHTYQKGYYQKRTQITCWWGCGETVQCWWECKSVQALWKAVWSFLKKLQLDPPYHPAFLLLLLSHFSRVRLCVAPDGSPPGSPIPGILQARILEWVAVSFSNGDSESESEATQSCPTCSTRPLRPWDFPGKSTGMGCHCLLWSSNSTWVYIWKKPKTWIQKNTLTPMVIAALFTIANIWKQPKCPSIDEWIKMM